MREFDRILIGEEKFYSMQYKRMKRRICYVVVLMDGRLCKVLNLLWDKETNCASARCQMMTLHEKSFPFTNVGHHMVKVVDLEEVDVLDVSLFKEKLVYLNSKLTGHAFICRMPNLYGHGVIN